jgi:toxin HigB-1
MIKSIKHKELQLFIETGSKKLIQAEHSKKLFQLLLFLDAVDSLEDVKLNPKYRHSLKGDLKIYHSMTISGNWRLIFIFKNGDVYLVDDLDYHGK